MADDRPEFTPEAQTAPTGAASALAALYETDVMAWSEQQAATLRARLALPGMLDWDNLAEEIEDVGKSQHQSCESQVENIVEHLLKLEFVTSPRDYPHWRGEVRNVRYILSRRVGPTIRKRLIEDLDATQAVIVRTLLDRELPGFAPEHAASALAQPYSWTQITDPEWLPSARAEAS